MNLLQLQTDCQVLLGDTSQGSMKRNTQNYTDAINWAQTQIGSLMGLTYLEQRIVPVPTVQPNGTTVQQVAIPTDAVKADRMMLGFPALAYNAVLPWPNTSPDPGYFCDPPYSIIFYPAPSDFVYTWSNPVNMTYSVESGVPSAIDYYPTPGLPDQSLIEITGTANGFVAPAAVTTWDFSAIVTTLSGNALAPGNIGIIAITDHINPFPVGAIGPAMQWSGSSNITITDGANTGTCTFSLSSSAAPGDTVTLTMTYDLWVPLASYSRDFTVIENIN